MADGKARKVTYFYDSTIGNYSYGAEHDMQPIRIADTDNLVQQYGLYKHMNVVVPIRATDQQMRKFHQDDYVDFLKSVSPQMLEQPEYKSECIKKFGCGDGVCPVFDGVYEYSSISAGGSIMGAKVLNQKSSEIVINWAGGLHHAKRKRASGFCYVNDIVLAILELLTVHRRVLYVDVDVHHGDGIEYAFYNTDRVMTVSFHKYDTAFFPKSGNFNDIGVEAGTNYNLNVPLDDGITDQQFTPLFKAVMGKVMDVYQPDVVVLQCGAGSLYGDKLGTFKLTIKGHASCLEFLRTFNVPMMVLGGGGYTVENVAKCWSYETAVALDLHTESDLPFSLDLTPPPPEEEPEEKNRDGDLEELRNQLLQRVSSLAAAPSIQFMSIPC